MEENIKQFSDYLLYERNRSEMTANGYAEDLMAFKAYCEKLDTNLSFETITSDIVRSWIESMIDKGNSATSVNRRLSALRSFYRFALMRNLVVHNPTRKVCAPKKSQPLPQFLRESEINKLLDNIPWDDSFISVRNRTIILTFYTTGMRISELVSLNDNSIDFIQKEIKVTGKGNKQRIIPFADELSQAISKYINIRNNEVNIKNTALFVSANGLRMQKACVRSMVKQELSKVTNIKKRTPHVLRHTFATAMLNHNANIESVRKLLGHESLSTTEIYTHTTFEQLKREYNNAHPRA